jgi:glycosyltransferase involved in cell wall biosynthesis
MDKRITVFTPTYNRAHLLERLYNSLANQSSKDFIWLVIDDGSVDGTEELIAGLIKKGVIQIEYRYKENGGMHTAYNMAYALIETELNVSIDSDDLMPPDAVEKILNIWDENKHDCCAGIIGLDADLKGNVIGTRAPEGLSYSTLHDLYLKHKVTGDKKLVYRSDVTKAIEPYPEFKGEKLVPLAYKYLLIDQKYNMIVTNEVLCLVEYQPEGSSDTVFKQYFESPKGFAELRKVRMRYSPYTLDRLKNAIHYVSSSIITGNRNFLTESPRKLLTLVAIPFGLLLTLYLKFKVKQ